MGRHQAANLIKHGYEVIVFDKFADAVDGLRAKGIYFT